MSVNTAGRALHVKNAASHRLYDYYMPTFLLKPLSQEEKDSIIAQLEKTKENIKKETENPQEEGIKKETENPQVKSEEEKGNAEDNEKEPSIDGDLRRDFGISFEE